MKEKALKFAGVLATMTLAVVAGLYVKQVIDAQLAKRKVVTAAK
jgi:hypothetical protein